MGNRGKKLGHHRKIERASEGSPVNSTGGLGGRRWQPGSSNNDAPTSKCTVPSGNVPRVATGMAAPGPGWSEATPKEGGVEK
ncbi:hypothetical protein NL676_019898 [Syzygium grande]|nr:hypothetical protein NL676_019898 [Syzygium grande]